LTKSRERLHNRQALQTNSNNLEGRHRPGHRSGRPHAMQALSQL